MSELLSEGNLWVKLTPYRPSYPPPHYEELRPLHAELLRTSSQRLLWGCDRPHTDLPADLVPNADRLLDILFEWTTDAATRKAVLVDTPRNPKRVPAVPRATCFHLNCLP